MLLEFKKIDKQKVGFFRFKQLNDKYLITNDIGEWDFLNPSDFEAFLKGKIEQSCPEKYQELKSKGFIRDQLNFDDLAQRYAKKNMFLGQGPSLHIIVVTLRCDHKCIYCQAGSQSIKEKGLDMDISTAQKVVDRIFESPNLDIAIEFQGGEPLLNFETIKFITDYAYKKNKIEKKRLFICLVSNLASMDKSKLKYLIEKKISICTSLDGPEMLHNKNRLYYGKKNSYRTTIKWFKEIKNVFVKGRYLNKPNMLPTISKSSLRYYKEIVDEYVRLDCEVIHLRPVNPYGVAKKIWKKISYTAEEFAYFYKKTLDYILKLNLQGKKIHERTARIFLKKIFMDTDPNYLDIRSPCGAGLGQLAYNFNGDIYTCDEGRMLSRMGDESFKIGNVNGTNYREIMNSSIVKTMCIFSCLDNLPRCSQCVYKPYCGVCPLCNYVEKGNIFDQQPIGTRCAMHMAILDYLFEKLKEERYKKIFKNWAMKQDRGIP